MCLDGFTFFLAEVSCPEHGKHEVHVVDVSGRYQVDCQRGYCYCQRKRTEQPDACVTDEVAEEHAFQEPYRIEKTDDGNVDKLRAWIVSRDGCKRVHDEECRNGGYYQLDEFLPAHLPE